MKKILLIILIMVPFSVFSQVQIMHQNTEIADMVQEISPSKLEEYIQGLVSFGTRHSLSVDQEGRGIEAARQYVLSTFESFEEASGGRLSAKIDYFTVEKDGRRIPEDVRMGNVMATLKGTDPADDRIFIVSGHLDSRVSDIMNAESDAPGANDDGSGVAALMEMARIMSKRSFSATIIFVAVSGEEQGLKGAAHLARKAKEEGWNLAAMINNDMIGNSASSGTQLRDNTRVRVFSEGVPLHETEEMAKLRQYTNGENDSKSRQLARYIKEIGERYVAQLEVKLVYRNDRFLRGGDHTPFSKEGFTAVRICEYNENYTQQHQDLRTADKVQYGDLPEHIDYEYLRKNSGVNLAVLASLASAPSVPQEVGIDVSELTNSTTLRWEEPENGKAKGYYVLMRETSSPVWEKKFFTDALSMTLPYSKDNYFFAVQAVGEGMVESRAVFPAPVR
ncbi:M28 family metallopeptidase [Echinicola vietnamensis]|uniref:Putative aminopeptidase n=1 Tax=Echinicola vietnamensis (strain DSM 17526 / LMG 23754 / KMM 6221) TaxID=926556 RepID=L0G0H9_ECHVK|nr:M28 family metallopeptidase [Echinicola vietnamensis]AGA78813.1 putative aminopeptidase [Echinicola vietnamensis DSM 17526]